MTPPSSTPCREGNEAGVLDGTVFVVAVALSKNTRDGIVSGMTQSWLRGSREQAITHALEFARKEKPDFNINDWLVTEIPARTQPPPLSDEGD